MIRQPLQVLAQVAAPPKDKFIEFLHKFDLLSDSDTLEQHQNYFYRMKYQDMILRLQNYHDDFAELIGDDYEKVVDKINLAVSLRLESILIG